jgi:predicted nucleic acid-binding protein
MRDILLSLAEKELYKPKWSDKIQQEWKSNLLENRKDIPEEILVRTIALMNMHFPDARIEHFEEIETSLHLPDPADNHVLAAAIKSKADVIVTNNIGDFPSEYISRFDIEIIDPDTFILNIIDLDPELAVEALTDLVARLKNPPQSIDDVFNTFERNGLVKTVQ